MYGLLQATKNLTTEQIQDLLHLRRMFYGRMGQLMRHRKQLLCQVPNSSAQLVPGTVELHVGKSDLNWVAGELRTNGADEYNAYTTFASVMFRGVRFCNRLFVGRDCKA